MIVIGEPNTRKTSTIRSLTGVGRKQHRWDVEYCPYPAPLPNAPSNIPRLVSPTYVQPAALQEVGITAQAFIADVNAAGVEHAIVALRLKATTRNGTPFPDAATYIAAFKAVAGWRVLQQLCLPLPQSPANKKDPANRIAIQARQMWSIS